MIDFNAALGSAGVGLRERRDGYEYLAETGRPCARFWRSVSTCARG